MAMFDSEMRYVAVSERWLSDYQLARSPVGLIHYDVFPEISEAWKAVHRRCLAGATESSEGEPFLRADGGVQWVKWSACPWRDGDGNVGGIVLTTEDITTRKEADAKAAHLASVVTYSSDAIIAMTLDCIVTSWNTGATRLLGYRAEEMIGRSIARIIQSERLGEEDQILERLRAGEAIEHFETQRIAKDGRVLDVSLSISPVKNALGAIDGVSKIMRDVTSRNAAQRELASTAAILAAEHETSPDGILVVDRMARIISVNHRFGEMFNVPAELLASQDASLVLPLALQQMKEAEALTRRVRYFCDHPEKSAHDELVFKDGRVLDRLTSPFKTSDGEYQGRIWFFRDITERRKAEESLRASEERFRMLVEDAPDAILLYDFDRDRFLATNKAAERLFGVPRDEILAHGPRRFFSWEQPDARLLAQSFSEHNERALAGEEVTFERRIQRPSGEERVCRITLVRLPSNVRLLRASLVDITERRRAEEALRRSEEQLRLALQGARAAAWGLNIVTGEANCTPEEYALHGRDPESVKPSYEEWLASVHPDDRAVAAAAVKDALEKRTSEMKLEYRVALPSGEIRWLAGLGKVEFADDGTPLQMSGIHLDITDRKRAELSARESEAALRQSQKRLRHAVDAGQLTYAEFDLRTGLARAAENYARVMGYAPLHEDGVLDVTAALSRLVTHVAPEDRAGVREKIRSALSGEFAIVESEFRVLGDDGATRWIRSVGQADLGTNGLPERIFVTNLDVTPQVEAREALNRAREKTDEILSSIADVFFALDADWRYVYFNDRAELITHKKREEVLGRRIFEVFPALENSEVHRGYHRAMTERTPIEFEAFSPAIKRWTFLSVYPTREGGISVYYRDISEQKRIECEFAAAKMDAERANLAKSKFLAAASHDLRQPVQSLVLQMAVAERQIAANPRALETLGKMRGSLEGLNGLLSAILDVSRLDAGVEAQPQAVDLGVLISRLAVEYKPKAEGLGLVLRVAARKLWATADPAMLERALRNLIENALRYTPAGGVLIGLRRRGDRVRIDVVDTGIGVPEEKRKEIFEEFVQLKNPGRQLGLGLGLGLAIVARIATLMNATIEVGSKEGKGSRFSLSLPASEVAPAVCRDSADDLEDPGGRVLIVEDNLNLRQGLEALLTQWGYETVAASDGKQALDVAERDGWRFGCIVTDQRLGAGLTGVETANEILRRSGRALPTLVLTGDTAKENITEIVASGFEVMHKPVPSEPLRRALARMMGA